MLKCDAKDHISGEECPYKSMKRLNIMRHKKSCPVIKRSQPLQTGIFTKEELGALYSETHVSMNEFNHILQYFKKKIGPEWFEDGVHKAATEYANSLGVFFETKVVTCKDEEGKDIQRTLSYCSDVPGLLDAVGIGRGGIKKETVIVSSDKGKYITINTKLSISNFL